MDRISDRGLDFNDFEQWCFDMGMAFARTLAETVLLFLDEKLLADRDKTVYRAKDKRPLTIKTLMGEVGIDRRLYKKNSGDDTGYVYLLDQAIGLDTIGKISINLIRRMTEVVTECSYRATSETISFTTGQRVGHMGVWNAVQAVGEKIREDDAGRAKLVKTRQNKGKKIVRALQEEFDGVWINTQGKDRPPKGRKAEMKLAVSYEGVIWTGKDKKGRSTYDMVNPLFMAGFEGPEEFFDKKEGQLGSVYNLDEIEARLVNGDGDSWVKSVAGYAGENVHIQLDPFHVKRAVRRSGFPKENQVEIEDLIRRKKTDEALEHIQTLTAKTTEPAAREKAEELFKYLNNNRECLIPVAERDLKLPAPPDDLIYGNMGTMEGNLCNLAALRMKKRKASFTKSGAVNLARLICCKRSGGLDAAVYGLSASRLPMILEEVITIVLSAAKAPKKDGEGYFYPANGGMPFKDTFMTNGRRAIKDMASYRTFTELAFQ